MGPPPRGTETRFDGGEQRASTGVGGVDRRHPGAESRTRQQVVEHPGAESTVRQRVVEHPGAETGIREGVAEHGHSSEDAAALGRLMGSLLRQTPSTMCRAAATAPLVGTSPISPTPLTP